MFLLVLLAYIVTTSKALVPSSDALVSNFKTRNLLKSLEASGDLRRTNSVEASTVSRPFLQNAWDFLAEALVWCSL